MKIKILKKIANDYFFSLFFIHIFLSYTRKITFKVEENY